MTGGAVNLVVDDSVATLTLARPRSGNAFDTATAHEFAQALAGAQASAAVLVLRGEGRLFCAGGDVAMMARAPSPHQALGELVDALSAGMAALARSSLVVVSVIHGAVAGAGMALPLLSDYVIASPSATFVSGYSGIGVTPDCGVSYLLPRAIGERRALQFALMGQPVDAATALSWGVVDELVPDTDLDSALARVLARATGGQAVAPTRALIRDLSGMEQHMSAEREQIVALAATEEASRLIQAFAQR